MGSEPDTTERLSMSTAGICVLAAAAFNRARAVAGAKKVRCCCTLFLALGHMRVPGEKKFRLGTAHGAHGLSGVGAGLECKLRAPTHSDGKETLPGRGPAASASYLFRYRN